ncbi:MAG: tRNA (N(6)-L-threonylcarbamoyladenosine(37)-C(2))-methylthiotransferase MtaB [Clostridiales bacterium]|nr:tRNA (N(6)-L-threonylcarbamoyladenosine(37)-C(2))-methylthiotransferase MtaB [Clostridiales bacterium]
MKVYFYTLGCRVNQYETDAARNLFIEKGHTITDDPADADVCVINTCTVTHEADRKSRQSLRKAARINPDAIVVAMGCASEMAAGVIDADIVLGTRDKNLIVDKVQSFIDSGVSRKHKAQTTRPEVSRKDDYHDFGSVLSPEGTRAYIKIEDGCNHFCTYCIIPFARGRVCSRPFEDIVREAEFLAGEGFREVVVTGIHTCSYGSDQGRDITALYEVLEAINGIEGIERIRLSSLEPLSMTDQFISSLKDIDKLCPHFHLSLQSGSDKILKAMNRHYTTAVYAERVDKIREIYPDMALTTDVICGFPGETDDEFAETLDYVRRLKFAKVHVFPYSERTGTVAASMPGSVPVAERRRRASELIALSSELENEFASRFVNRSMSILLESDKNGVWEGLTPEHVKTFVEGSGTKGSIINVKIDKYSDGCLYGKSEI